MDIQPILKKIRRGDISSLTPAILEEVADLYLDTYSCCFSKLRHKSHHSAYGLHRFVTHNPSASGTECVLAIADVFCYMSLGKTNGEFTFALVEIVSKALGRDVMLYDPHSDYVDYASANQIYNDIKRKVSWYSTKMLTHDLLTDDTSSEEQAEPCLKL